MAKLVSLAQRHISDKLGRRVDAEDIVQSAFRSFFLGARDGRFSFEQEDDLWHLLAVITLKKVHKKVEFHSAAKRGMDREQATNNDLPDRLTQQAISREPSIDEAAALLDEIDLLAEGLDGSQRQILELRLQGYELAEIAEQVQKSERTVRRVLEKVKQRLMDRISLDADS